METSHRIFLPLDSLTIIKTIGLAFQVYQTHLYGKYRSVEVESCLCRLCIVTPTKPETAQHLRTLTWGPHSHTYPFNPLPCKPRVFFLSSKNHTIVSTLHLFWLTCLSSLHLFVLTDSLVLRKKIRQTRSFFARRSDKPVRSSQEVQTNPGVFIPCPRD
jgi:hypothetical protein